MMAKKDYIAIANIITDTYHGGDIFTKQETEEYLAKSLAKYMASDNPHFDRQKFLKACGVEK